MARLRPVAFEDRLTLVEHLDELRSRLIVSALVFIAALAFCFWQNDLLLEIANEPLPNEQPPITFSPTEPFFTTVRISVYAGILIALPVLLYQAYAFLLPAFSPHEKRVVLPFLMMVPVLFVAGAAFAYFVVVPAALDFLLEFNADEFDINIRASEYYGFLIFALISVGILFQIPIGVLSVTRLGIVTPEQLAANRRYAVLIIAVLAMLLPGTDPVTMLISMAPLVLLFELSILLARAFGRPPEEETEAEAAASGAR